MAYRCAFDWQIIFVSTYAQPTYAQPTYANHFIFKYNIYTGGMCHQHYASHKAWLTELTVAACMFYQFSADNLPKFPYWWRFGNYLLFKRIVYICWKRTLNIRSAGWTCWIICWLLSSLFIRLPGWNSTFDWVRED